MRIAMLGWMLAAAPLAAQTLPPDLALAPVATGLSNAVAVRHASDGSGRRFVVRQQGLISLILADGTLAGTPFLNIGNGGTPPPLGFTSGGERGLLGLAFHPQYALNGRFFLYYTDGGGDIAITEYRVSGSDANRADATSGRTLLRVWKPASNHNGGDLHFGPDGYLYIGTGDGGNGDDTPCNAGQALSPSQLGGNLCTISAGDTFLQVPSANAPRASTDARAMLGKMLRIDVDVESPRTPGAAGADLCGRDADTGIARYDIPPDNPFAGDAGGNASACDETYHYGLRNPWRFSFDRDTGDLIIGDVGQGAWEEVDLVPPGGGRNFGWRLCEGFHVRGSTSTLCTLAGRTDPIMVYGRTTGFSITGGWRYRGPWTQLDGVLFFADYGGALFAEVEGPGGWNPTPTPWATNQGDIVGFGEDEGGSVHLTTLGGSVRRFVLTGTPLPAALRVDAHARISVDAGTLGLADPGDTLELHASVFNAGGETLDQLVVSGRFAAGVPVTLTCSPTTLAPSRGANCTAILRVLDQAAFEARTPLVFDVEAEASAGGNAAVTHQDSVALPLAALRAALTVSKNATLMPDTGTPGVADVGDVVNYSVSVANAGNVGLDGLVVMDQLDGGAATTLACTPTTLASGDVATCTAYQVAVTQAHIDAQQSLLNVASASARDALDVEVQAMDDASMAVAAAAPALGFDKQVELIDADGDQLADPGESLVYRFVATNAGNVTLTALTVDDAALGGAVACTPATLAPQQVANCGPVDVVVTPAQSVSGAVTNTARARATAASGGEVQSPPDSTNVATDARVEIFANGFESG